MFDGDFDTLPLHAHIVGGPVPAYPVKDDFELASIVACNADPFSRRGAALVWRLEAIRYRRTHPAAPLSGDVLREIASAAAEALSRRQIKELAA